MTTVELPKANENLTEATLDRWLVQEGGAVRKDQALCEIITDKAKFEMPSPADGTVLKIFGLERAVLPVGYVLCVIGAPGEAVSADLAAKNEALLAAHRGAVTALGLGVSNAGQITNLPHAGVRATPAARRVAKEAGVDLAAVAEALKLTGPVTEKDVKTYIERRDA